MRAMARSSWDTAVMALEMPRSMCAGMRLWLWWSLALLDPATLVELVPAFFLLPALGLFFTCEYLAGIVVVVAVVDDEDVNLD